MPNMDLYRTAAHRQLTKYLPTATVFDRSFHTSGVQGGKLFRAVPIITIATYHTPNYLWCVRYKCMLGIGQGGGHMQLHPRSKPTWLKRPVHNVLFFKQSFWKWERQGLVGGLRNRPTCRARLRSRTTASSGMHHITTSCMSYTHVYSATRGC